MLQDQKLLQPPPSGTLALSLQIQLLGVGRITLEARVHHLHDILYALPGGIFCGGYRTINHRRQGYGGVMTLEARQDVFNQRSAELATLCLQAGPDDLIQAIGGRVQHRKGIGDRRWQLRHRDGAHPKWHQCCACLAGPFGNALDPDAVLCLEIFKGFSGGLHCLGARRRLRRIELADLLLQFPLPFLCFKLVLGQQLASPGEHFFLEGEIRLSLSEVCLSPVQGLLLRLKVFLGKDGVAGLALELLLPFLQPFHILDLLGPLGFQSLVWSTQLGLVLCREGLPLGHGFLPPGHLLLPPGRLQLPGAHPLEVPLVLLAVSLELGPLGDELSGHRLGALL
jgi:hypothetical protein